MKIQSGAFTRPDPDGMALALLPDGTFIFGFCATINAKGAFVTWGDCGRFFDVEHFLLMKPSWFEVSAGELVGRIATSAAEATALVRSYAKPGIDLAPVEIAL